MVRQGDVVCMTIILTWSHGLAGWCGMYDNHSYLITCFGRVVWYVRQSFLLDHMVWQGGVVCMTIILTWSHGLAGWCGMYDNHSYLITWFGRLVWYVPQSFLLDHMVWQGGVVSQTIIFTWSHGLAGRCGRSHNHSYLITWFGRVVW